MPLNNSLSRKLLAERAILAMVNPSILPALLVRQPTGRKQHTSGQNHKEEGEGQKNLPAQTHQLIIAIAWEGCPHPEEAESDECNLPGKPQAMPDNLQGAAIGKGLEIEDRQPTTEEQDGGHGTHQPDIGVFAEAEKRKGHRRIFGEITGYLLGSSFRQIKRRTIGFRQSRDKEHRKHRQ